MSKRFGIDIDPEDGLSAKDLVGGAHQFRLGSRITHSGFAPNRHVKVRVTGTLEQFRKFGLSDGKMARLTEESAPDYPFERWRATVATT